MRDIISFLIFFGVVFALVLFGMLAFIKLGHGRVEPSEGEKKERARYMADAPAEAHGPQGPG